MVPFTSIGRKRDRRLHVGLAESTASDSETSINGVVSLIESISIKASFQRRHCLAPLLKEREQYLTHLLQIGWDTKRVRATAGYLVHVVHLMRLTSLRSVELAEIDEAGVRWADDKGSERIGRRPDTSPRTFAITARQWLRFHGALIVPSASSGRFDAHLSEFKGALKSRGLAHTTTLVYVSRIRNFLQWGISAP